MKQTEHRSGRMSRRARGAALTALVIVAVILLNVAFGLLSDRYLLLIDQTVATKYPTEPTSLYTVEEALTDLIGNSVVPMVDQVNADRAQSGEEPIKIKIIFCDDKDKINAATASRFAMYTALGLQKAFPEHIDVSFVNIAQNPSAVQKYKVTSSSRIYASNIIFDFGTEYRVYSMSSLFMTDSDSGETWAYDGERVFATAILAVTRAESPIACFITNHGENVTDCRSLRTLVERAGYVVMDLDLEQDEIPENCRMLISYDPQTDFYAPRGLGAADSDEGRTSEIDKLDEYLDQCYSFMLFVDNETPAMPNLDEYLEEWGVTVSRVESEDGSDNYHIRDNTQKLDKDGYTLLGTYATAGLGASITSDMRESGYPAKVVFPNATAISMADGYSDRYVAADETAGTEGYRYGGYFRNGVSRYMYDVFLAGSNAVAEVNGEQYEITTADNSFKLMTVTSEERTITENTTTGSSVSDRSFVCVFGSTEFASDELLDSSSYGNTDVLTSALRAMGREVVPVNLPIKVLKKYVVEDATVYTTSGVIATTVCLAVIPAVVCFGAGIYVTVRRKYR